LTGHPRRANRAGVTSAFPSVSIIIEWENARLSELGRTRRMLAALAAQLPDIAPASAELIVLHDAEAVPPALIQDLLREAFGAAPPPLQLIPTHDSQYYRQKNHGASLARHEVVLFLDSDVVPEPGWLAALLGHLSDPAVGVVGGNTYIEPDSLYARAFALFWFFPLREVTAETRDTTHFFANNVAFRRALFARHGFPELPLMRGQCGVLAATLRAAGHGLLIETRARVSHPAPNGGAHFLRRALCDGHDTIQRHRLGLGVRGGLPFGTVSRLGRGLRDSARRIAAGRRAVGLGPAGALAALGVAGAYLLLAACGEVLGRLAPGLVRRHLAV
jgi:hypothetical protein